MRNKKRLYSLCATLVLLIVAAAVIYIAPSVQPDPSAGNSVSPSGTHSSTDTPGSGTSIEVTGKIICLPHKDTTGPVDAMCAIGLDADDGKNYALSSDDPSTTGSMPTEQKVTVTGTFKEQSSQYDSVGIITVQSIKR